MRLSGFEDSMIQSDDGNARHEGVTGQEGGCLIKANAPHRNARAFLFHHYTTAGIPTLRHGAGTWYAWTGTHYEELKPDTLRARAWRWLSGCQVEAVVTGSDGKKGNRSVPFEPSSRHVSGLVDALRGLCDVPNYDGSQLGVSLGEGSFPPPERIVPFRNGLLDLDAFLRGEARLIPHTPFWFSLSCLPHAYVPDAACPTWEGCIEDWTLGDPGRREVLQMWMGLNLTTDMSQHRMLFLLGKGRNGKGTYADVLQQVIGAGNACNPSFSEMGERFTLMGFVGKLAAIFGDAHLGSGRASDVIVERIERITGGDPVDIDRKNREPLTGVSLTTRFTVLSNGLPRLPDASGVIADRVIFVRFLKDYRGREDLGLKDLLRAELPGIANWALRGLALLRGRGRLVQPACDAQVAEVMGDQSSPIRAFVEQDCVLGDDAEVEAEWLRERWKAWCEVEGHRPGSSGHLTALLLSVDPRISSIRRRPENRRHFDRKKTYYRGIGLSSQAMSEVAAVHLMRTGEILHGFLPSASSSPATETMSTSPEMGEEQVRGWFETNLGVRTNGAPGVGS
jgi:putative DNA primase/helicase